MERNNNQIIDLMIGTLNIDLMLKILKAAEIDINDSKKLRHFFKQFKAETRGLFIKALQETGQENKVGKVYFVLQLISKEDTQSSVEY